jgi:hypothetical protein
VLGVAEQQEVDDEGKDCQNTIHGVLYVDWDQGSVNESARISSTELIWNALVENRHIVPRS